MKKSSLLIIFTSVTSLIAGLETRAQGISEYGGLMAMPKPMGSAQTMGGSMNKLYGAPTRALQGLGATGQTGGRPSPSARSANLGTPVTSAKGASSTHANNKADVLKLSAQAQEHLKQAKAFEKAGKWSEAEAAYKKSLGIRETYWKDRDPAIPDILNALAEVSIAQENAEACRKYLNASLVVLGKLYGPGTAHRIKPLALQASLYEAQNDPGRALDSYQQCKTLADRLTPAEKSKYLMPELSEKIDHKCVELLAQLSQRPSEHSEESSKTTHSTSETPASK